MSVKATSMAFLELFFYERIFIGSDTLYCCSADVPFKES